MSDTLAGHPTRIRRFAGNDDRPALALHCMMGHSGAFMGIAEALADAVQITAFDLPGHGGAAPFDPAAGLDLTTLCTRMAGAEISRPVDLIGHSFGAVVALRLALRAPQAVRSLTLIEPVLFAAAQGSAAFAQARDEGLAMRAHLDRGEAEAAARAFMARWGGVGGWDTLPAPVRAQFTAQVALVDATGPDVFDDRGGLLAEGGLEALDLPVMLIAGADSPPVIGAIQDAIADRLPDVARAQVPGAGHMLPITHPLVVANLIRLNLDRS
ncbi:alpha/beta fold hydrolase [Paracoccus sp. p4-l81]|uniref:alpha/beta fold hydrolase n=1 Tax=Paracoccus sp. p4-l81 TaxID=3342806 RepID=UPI0035BA76B0